MKKNIFYQFWPISWVGGNSSAFSRMTDALDHLEEMGVTHIWISPVYESDWKDHGYDVVDYFRIDSRFGTEAEFSRFVNTAHEKGMQVLIDIVVNHVSINNRDLFNPRTCIFRSRSKTGWKNLFDGCSAWSFSKIFNSYYLHLFSEYQADLNWFQGKKINAELVEYFQNVCRFYIDKYGIDGFRIDAPQAINKDPRSKSFDFWRCLGTGLKEDKSIQVLNAIFCGVPTKMLITEIFDPDNSLSERYVKNSPVNLTMNLLLRDMGLEQVRKQVLPNTAIHYLESHDTNRVLSRFGINMWDEANLLCREDVNNICIYQGQEYGVKNPSPTHALEFSALDAEFAMKFANKSDEDIEDIVKNARANNRVSIDSYDYNITNRGIFTRVLKNWNK